MVAFVASLLLTLALTGLVVVYAKRRPIDATLTWGEAMAAAAFVFLVAFLAYGVVPHQWLSLADNELGWRRDKILTGPAGVLRQTLPFTLNYEVLRDMVAAGLYVAFLGGQMVMWSVWQNRGRVKPAELPVSAYGRPLLKRAP